MPLPPYSVVLLSTLLGNPLPQVTVSEGSGAGNDVLALAEPGTDTTAGTPDPNAPADTTTNTEHEETAEADADEQGKEQKKKEEPGAPVAGAPASEPSPTPVAEPSEEPKTPAPDPTGFSVGVGVADSATTRNDQAIEDKGTVAAPDEQGTRIVGAFITGAAEVDVGSGTFVIDEASRNEYVAWNGVLIPGYQFGDRTRLSLVASLTQELTQSDSASTAHQLQLSDLRFGVSRPLYVFEKTETQLFGELYAYAPTSLASQFDGLYTALDARLSVQQPVGDFFFSYRTAFRKNFHRYVTPVLSEEDSVDKSRNLRTELAREGGNELVDAGIAIGGQNNISFTWSNQLLAAYSFSDKLSIGAVYVLAHGWTYESFPRDELTSENAVPGRGRRDSSSTDISISYQLLDDIGLSAGVHTVSSPRASDTRSIRFPFYEFSGAELNYSTFYVSATVTEKIPL